MVYDDAYRIDLQEQFFFIKNKVETFQFTKLN